MAEWVDSATLPRMSRDALEAASGITVPSSTFVLKVILAYLIALVPLNWLICRYALGRREWAWAVVPALSLGFAIGVERLAAYDVGYDVACDEIDVVEAYGDYPRAHVSRFASLFTTGRGRFTISYPKEATALALPMDRGRSLVGEDVTTSAWQSSPVPALDGFQVEPRSLAMFRAEQMSNLAGPIALVSDGTSRRVVNQSELELRDAVLVDVAGYDDRRETFLGTIAPGGSAEVRRGQGVPSGQATSIGEIDPRLFLREFRMFGGDRPEEKGEIRLVAWAPRRSATRSSSRRWTGIAGSPPWSSTSATARRRPPTGRPTTGSRASRRRPRPRPAPGPPAGPRPGRRPAGPLTAAPDDRPGDGQPMIEVIHFTKRYGDFVAVDDLSFAIGQGEVFGFIGPNGAGKSTTIRFLATLLRPTSGQGRVAGHSVVDDPMAVRRVIGFMPDDFGVYDGMKVWEFLDFFAVAYEIPQSYRRKIIGEVLELLDLSHKRDDYVNGLSKGMKQRLCLAKTLVHDPPVLILDEPASGLDPRARLEMKALLNELRGMGKTILISSHILSELADFCTSIGIIERGKLLAAGSIQEIQRQLAVAPRAEGPRARRRHRPRRGDPPRRPRRPRRRGLRPHRHRRVRRPGRGHGPHPRPPHQLRRRRPLVRRGGIEPRRGLHDDYEGNCKLNFSIFSAFFIPPLSSFPLRVLCGLCGESSGFPSCYSATTPS